MTVTVWTDMSDCDSLVSQLSFCVERWDAEGKFIRDPNAEHVRVLWRMDRDKRVQVWRALSRFQSVEGLELAGEMRCECPMGVEELFMLLPETAGALAGQHELFLRHCSIKMDDEFLRALASAGCGQMLTSLHLGSERL